MRNQSNMLVIIFLPKKIENGSLKNGTVRKAKMFAAIKNRLYLCSAFETQVQDIEY